MPQFDPTYFAPQLVWLAITFLALYLLMSKLILPRLTGILAQREDRIDGNLKRAEALKEEAAQVLAAYQKAIADARAQAQSALAKAAADTARREADFAKKLAEQTAAAEAGIRAAKTQALADVRGIASEVAALMTNKVTGAAVDASAVVQAVDGVMRERGR